MCQQILQTFYVWDVDKKENTVWQFEAVWISLCKKISLIYFLFILQSMWQ
jgi:hypothetical protein